jgi:hypothetical protein
MTKRTAKSRRPGLRHVATAVIVSVGATTAAVSAADASTIKTQVRDASATPAIARSGNKHRQPFATVDPVPIHGVAADGTTQLNGTFTLTRMRVRHGVLYAVGKLQGTLGDRRVDRFVAIPVKGASAVSAPGTTQGFLAPQQVPPTPGACSILTLNLGPLDLNLLGLRVALDEVNLLIEAVPGAGNLLGNLLCAVAGLLDGGLPGGLGGLVNNVLIAIGQLLNGLLRGV